MFQEVNVSLVDGNSYESTVLVHTSVGRQADIMPLLISMMFQHNPSPKVSIEKLQSALDQTSACLLVMKTSRAGWS